MNQSVRWEILLENSKPDSATLERSALSFLVSQRLSKGDEEVDATEKYIAEAKASLDKLVNLRVVTTILDQKEFGELFSYWNGGSVEGEELKKLMILRSEKASDDNDPFDPEFSRLQLALISKLRDLGLQSTSGFHNEIFIAIFYETSQPE